MLGTTLKQRREELSLTQQQVADQLHVARQTVSNWETGKNYPDIPTLIKISDIYALSLDIMLKGDASYMTQLQKDARQLKTLKKMRFRFGPIGTLLYKHYHNDPRWGKKNFIFWLFGGTFFSYSFVVMIVIYVIEQLAWHEPIFTDPLTMLIELGIFLLILIPGSMVYGLWATDYFRK